VDVQEVRTDELTSAQRDDLTALMARRFAVDEHPALPDPQRLALSSGDGIGAPHPIFRLLLVTEAATLRGCGVLSTAGDGSLALHIVIDPDQADPSAVRHVITKRAVAIALDLVTPLRLWIMQATADDDNAVAADGFTPDRELIQMRVPLPLPAELLAQTRPVTTRPFIPGQDEQAWLDINNRAFAGHPEQGGWTEAELRERLAADWVVLDGFLMADAPDGSGLVGSCWTKIHRLTHPPMGEIYVISVNPDRQGQKWGKSLTVAGLNWLAQQGLTVGMLYTDADNTAAVAMYHALGFADHHIDRAYLYAKVD
jgi:mycothiol synthase